MSTRALTREQTARIRQRLDELVKEYDSEPKLARAMKNAISQQTINRIRNGDPAGLMVARKLAQFERVTVESILDGIPVELGRVLRESPGQWTKPAVAAVTKHASEATVSRSEAEWRSLLDDVARRLAPVLPALPTKRI